MARSINLKNWILMERMKIHSGIDEEPILLCLATGIGTTTATDCNKCAKSAGLKLSRAMVAKLRLWKSVLEPPYPQRGVSVSKEFGARIIRINLREGLVASSKDVGFALGALEGLQRINSELGKIQPNRRLQNR